MNSKIGKLKTVQSITCKTNLACSRKRKDKG